MPPLPKRRISRGRQGKRRSVLSLKRVTLEVCPQCGGLKRPHTLCPNCGSYRGKVITLKKEKGSKKKKT